MKVAYRLTYESIGGRRYETEIDLDSPAGVPLRSECAKVADAEIKLHYPADALRPDSLKHAYPLNTHGN